MSSVLGSVVGAGGTLLGGMMQSQASAANNTANINAAYQMDVVNTANQNAVINEQLANQTAINNAQIAAAQQTNQANIANQDYINQQTLANQTNINNANIANQQYINAQNIANQNFLAGNSIQMRVADAKAAGINPLAALGASGATPATLMTAQQQALPLQMATQTAPQLQRADLQASARGVAPTLNPTGWGGALAQASQDIGRAISSTATAEDREFVLKQRALSLQNDELKNAILMSQFRTLHQPGNGPPTPALGAKYVVDGQSRTTTPGSTAATAVPDSMYFKRPDGSVYIMPSKPYGESSFGSDLAKPFWDIGHVGGALGISSIDNAAGWLNSVTGQGLQGPSSNQLFWQAAKAIKKAWYGMPVPYQ